MKLSEIYAVADRIAPKRISDEMCEKYGWYDNSGILVDVGEEIRGIVFSLDLSVAAVDCAIEKGANLIITHHPAIYGKISRIDCHDEGLLGQKLVRCIRNGISVIAMHLNLDAAADGIDESLMQGVALAAGSTARLCACQLTMAEGGYGRAYDLQEVDFDALMAGLKRVFSSERVVGYPLQKTLSRVASFCGSGADEEAISFALAQGADVILSADFKHHVLSLALESGLSVVTLTHYAAENYGFKKYYEKISRQVDVPCVYHVDERLL